MFHCSLAAQTPLRRLGVKVLLQLGGLSRATLLRMERLEVVMGNIDCDCLYISQNRFRMSDGKFRLAGICQRRA